MEVVRAIKLYLNSKLIDITSSVQSKLNLIERVDEVFDTGSFTAFLTTSKNIPPYTLCEIETTNRMVQFWTKSTCSKYPTNNLYIHNFELIEITAIASCYILGSKSFSTTGTNKLDYEKINIIISLINYKYGTSFSFNTSSFAGKFNNKYDYSFGPGTTLFDALFEIMKNYNCIPRINNSNLNDSYTITFDNLNNENESNIEYLEVINVEYNQSLEDYCVGLESEVTNVVDRDTPTTARNISVSCKEVQMTKEKSVIRMPCKIERITKAIAHRKTLFSTIQIGYINNTAVANWLNKVGASGTVEIVEGDMISQTAKFNLYNWISQLEYSVTIDGSEATMQALTLDDLDKISTSFPEIAKKNSTTMFHIKRYGTSPLKYILVNETAVEGCIEYELTDRVLEKNQWGLLSEKDQISYAYYSKGDYYIEGLYRYYNDDFWNWLCGQASYNSFLSVCKINDIQLSDNMVLKTVTTGSDSPYDYTFDITYIPYTDFFISESKDIAPINEANYKNIFRSYDQKANNIDFNRMAKSIAIKNKSIGVPELMITGIANAKFEPNKTITYDGITWKISSVQNDFTSGLTKTTLGLVSDINKAADSIGVETQFDSTKNPLNNIVNRVISFEMSSYIDSNGTKHVYYTDTEINQFLEEGVDICITCYYADGSNKHFYKRAAITNYDNTYYFVAESIDQYAIDSVIKSSTGDYKLCYDVGLGDSNNEVKSVTLKLSFRDKSYIYYTDYTEKLSSAEAFDYTLNGNSSWLSADNWELSSNPIPVYKDARERLIFVIKIRKEK